MVSGNERPAVGRKVLTHTQTSGKRDWNDRANQSVTTTKAGRGALIFSKLLCRIDYLFKTPPSLPP